MNAVTGNPLLVVAWLAAGIAAWCVVALVVGLVLVLVIRNRDKQVPR